MNIKTLEKYWGVKDVNYGFIYKWTDHKRGRYYVGSHWGKFDDGYICSSNSMRERHRLRPETFTRRILAVVGTNRLDLLNKEQEYLDKIPRKHFGTDSYNISIKVHKPWWAKGSKLKKRTIAKMKDRWTPERKAAASDLGKKRQFSTKTRTKMSSKAKERWSDPKQRKKQSRIKKKLFQSPEGKIVIAKMSESLKGRSAWNIGVTLSPLPKKQRIKISESLTGIKRSSETKAKVSVAAKLRWKKPEYRRKLIEARDTARRNGKLKVNFKQAARIRNMYTTGRYTMRILSDEFGVSESYIHSVIHDDKWIA